MLLQIEMAFEHAPCDVVHDCARERGRTDDAQHTVVHRGQKRVHGGLHRKRITRQQLDTAVHARQTDDLPCGVEREVEHDRKQDLVPGKAVADGDRRIKVEAREDQVQQQDHQSLQREAGDVGAKVPPGLVQGI